MGGTKKQLEEHHHRKGKINQTDRKCLNYLTTAIPPEECETIKEITDITDTVDKQNDKYSKAGYSKHVKYAHKSPRRRSQCRHTPKEKRPSPHRQFMPKSSPEIEPLDSRTAKSVLAAFAKHVGTYDKHYGNGDLKNKRIAIISDDHKIAVTPKLEAELRSTITPNVASDMNINDNQGYPLTYRLSHNYKSPKKTCEEKKKRSSPTRFKTKGTNNLPSPTKQKREKSMKTPNTIGRMRDKTENSRTSPVQSNKQYLCIVPESDIDAFQCKKHLTYGPFFFVKNTLNEGVEKTDESSFLSIRSDSAATFINSNVKRTTVKSDTTVDDEHEDKPRLHQGGGESPGHEHFINSAPLANKAGAAPLSPRDKYGENKVDFRKTSTECPPTTSVNGSSKNTAPSAASHELKNMKYLKANVELFIGVGVKNNIGVGVGEVKVTPANNQN